MGRVLLSIKQQFSSSRHARPLDYPWVVARDAIGPLSDPATTHRSLVSLPARRHPRMATNTRMTVQVSKICADAASDRHSSADRPLAQAEANSIAEDMRAFSAESGCGCCSALVGAERTVEELARTVEMEPSAVSQQLRVLRQLNTWWRPAKGANGDYRPPRPSRRRPARRRSATTTSMRPGDGRPAKRRPAPAERRSVRATSHATTYVRTTTVTAAPRPQPRPGRRLDHALPSRAARRRRSPCSSSASPRPPRRSCSSPRAASRCSPT